MHDKIICIRGKISNVYLLNDDKIAIVDTGSPNDLPLIISCIKDELKRSMHDVDFIIPTHSHLEHMGGADKIKKIARAKIIFSKKSGHPFEGGVSYLKKFRKGIKAVTAALRNNPEFFYHPLMQLKNTRADIVSFDGMDLPGHPGWRIIFTPGHSPCCISLYNSGTKSLISGDAVITIAGSISRSIVVWDSAAYDRSLNKLKSLSIDHLYPGHGEPVHGKDLQNMM